MKSSDSSRPPRGTRQFTAGVRVNGRPFEFKLMARRLPLGPDVSVDYVWMDSSHFRRALLKGADPTNFRNCVGLWWAAMCEEGLGQDAEQIVHLLFAASHALGAKQKSLQHVYADAYLAPGGTRPQDGGLPDEDRAAVAEAVRARDPRRVHAELERLFGRPAPPAEYIRPLAMLRHGIIRDGVELFARNGAAGLHKFLGKFGEWAAEARRKGGRPLLRAFLDHWAYEAKMRFYLCYANAWVALIPWLEEHRGLDTVSARFLSLWHMQSRPVALPDGGDLPDVFAGQVLALHPLSAFFMKDPALCGVAGRFFAGDAYARVFDRGDANVPEYWDLVGAILTAAHLYRRAADCQDERRKPDAGVDPGDLPAPPGGGVSELGMLQDFVDTTGVRCGTCREAARVIRFETLDTTCRLCLSCPGGHRTCHDIPEDVLTTWLRQS